MESQGSLARRRGGALRRFGWLAAAVLLAVSVFAPSASAHQQTSNACEGASFVYSVDGGAHWRPVTTNDSESAYPLIAVWVKVDGELPEGCSQAFSLASYNADGPTWPTSGTQTFLDYDTGTIDSQHPQISLEVKAPECYGQTDFYWGSIIYDGKDAEGHGPLPNYDNNVPTPYDKISGSNGGHKCADPTPTPTATPTETPSDPPSQAPAEGAIEIQKIDNKGTQSFEDDVLLNGASFALYRDNGDSAYSAVTDTLVSGPSAAVDGTLTIEHLTAGSYWVVETVVPAGFTGTDPILVALNLDPSLVCLWDRDGLHGCEEADGDGPLDVVFVDNTPKPNGSTQPASSPNGEVQGVRGTPGATPPATDTIGNVSDISSGSWRIVLAGLAILIAISLLFTRPTRARNPR
jgi:hypothetical protein